MPSKNASKKSGYVGSSIDCRHCQRPAEFHSYRTQSLLTVGRCVTCHRAYYLCCKCGKGSCPWDARVGLTHRRLTPGVERLATLCGANGDSFEKAAELLHEASGIDLSESTIERVTEDVGERIAEHYDAGRTFGGKQKWEWYRDATGQTVGYIELDATGVPQQGIRGEKAEGRMAYVGMILNPLPNPTRVFEPGVKPRATMQARYVIPSCIEELPCCPGGPVEADRTLDDFRMLR